MREKLRISGICTRAPELLYRATVDGVTADDLRRKCAGKDSLLVIGREETDGWLYGCYLDYGINVFNDSIPFDACQLLVFSLSNPHGDAPVFGAVGKRTQWRPLLVTLGAESVLRWSCLDSLWVLVSSDIKGYGTRAFTGSESWTASDVLVYRVSCHSQRPQQLAGFTIPQIQALEASKCSLAT